jgi:C4-dicarboxylate-binding protein DctP
VKKIVALSILMLMVLSFGVIDTVDAANEEFTIQVGYLGGTDIYSDYEHTFASVFKHYVEADTTGNVKVELYPGGQLGSQEEMLESVQQNMIQASIPPDGTISRWFPEIQALTIPYLYENIEHARAMFDGPFGDILKEKIEKNTGVKVLAISEVGGFLHFATNERPILEPSDLEGMLIRTMPHEGYIKIIEAMGGTPTPMSFNEVYTSLQTGVIDGHFNPVSAMVSFNMHEVQDYLSLTGHGYGPMYLVINPEFFDSLPEEYQNAVLAAAQTAKTAARGVNSIAEVVGVQTLEEEGMEVYSITEEQRQMFIDASQDEVIEFFKEQFDNDWVNTIIEEAERAKTSN